MICLSARRLREGDAEKRRGGEGERRLQDSRVEITVSDSGVGIEPSSLPHIFQPFFTSFDVSRHSSGQFEFGRRGLGLGLTLVKAFVEMHGGQVQATSEPGKGTTFTISLPATT